jgi:hypothetical protein
MNVLYNLDNNFLKIQKNINEGTPSNFRTFFNFKLLKPDHSPIHQVNVSLSKCSSKMSSEKITGKSGNKTEMEKILMNDDKIRAL